MKKYISPYTDQVDFQMNGTICVSPNPMPSASPENSGRPSTAGAPARKLF